MLVRVADGRDLSVSQNLGDAMALSWRDGDVELLQPRFQAWLAVELDVRKFRPCTY